jgi:tetratricopeptide (TPR) repeat protein
LNQDQLNLDKVIEYGQLALEIDKSNTKALFRTGRAHLLKGELDQAKSKLKQASKNQPNDKAIREVS